MKKHIVVLSLLSACAGSLNAKVDFIKAKSTKHFDSIVADHTYTVVLFHDFNRRSNDYKKLKNTFDDVADLDKYEDRNDIKFVEVKVAENTFGADIFARYKPAKSEPYYILIGPAWFGRKGQRGYVSGDASEEQLEKFIDRYLSIKAAK